MRAEKATTCRVAWRVEMFIGSDGCVCAASRGEGRDCEGLVSGCAGQGQSTGQNLLRADASTHRKGNVIANLLAMNKLK